MSDDVTVTESVACPACGHCKGEVFEFSPTYNLRPMFHAAGFCLRDFNGMTGAEVAPVLTVAVASMEADPAKFRALDAPNGWGTYDDIMPYLRRFRDAVSAHPAASVVVT